MLVGLRAFKFDLLLLGLGPGVEALEEVVGEAVDCLPALFPTIEDARSAPSSNPVESPFSFSHLAFAVVS